MNNQKYGQFYKAIVVEIIKDQEDKPTLELRIKIPSIHQGLKDIDLPIAKPLVIPGTILDKDLFLSAVVELQYIYVMFDSGKLAKPLYIVSGLELTNEYTSIPGPQGEPGKDGKDGEDGEPGKDGEDGISPHIGSNGNWWVGDTNTGIKAQGKDATTKFLDPVIVMTGPEKLFQPNIYIYDGVLLSTNDTVLDHTSSKIYKYNGLIYEELHEVNIGEIMSITKGKKRGGLMYIKDELGFKKIKYSELSKWITIEGDI